MQLLNGFKRRVRNYRGFTISEILITLLIIGFVGSLGIPMITQHKVQPPKKTEKHGTMECFWYGDTLYQFTANNYDNPKGSLVPLEGLSSCTFKPTFQDKLIIQAIGGGGVGAKNSQNVPSEFRVPTFKVGEVQEEKGKIRTDENFYRDMHNPALPKWVREHWDKQWDGLAVGILPVSNWIAYEIHSPVGAGGQGNCKIKMKDSLELGAMLNECTALCSTDITRCPKDCRHEDNYNGTDSRAQHFYRVKVRLGKDDNVVMRTDTLKSVLKIGGNSVELWPSLPGYDAKADENGTMQHGSDRLALDVRNGKAPSFLKYRNYAKDNLTKINFNNYNMRPLLAIHQVKFDDNTKGKGGKGCSYSLNDYTAIDPARKGYITSYNSIGQQTPFKDIEYTSKQFTVDVSYGFSGEPGSDSTRILQSVPKGKEITLEPGKSGAMSTAKIEDQIIVEGLAGGTTHMEYHENQVVHKEDLPFFERIPKENFAPKRSNISIVKGAGYASALQKFADEYQYYPGSSGMGAYPIIADILLDDATGTGSLPFTGVTYVINNKIVALEPLKSMNTTNNKCPKEIFGTDQPKASGDGVSYCGTYGARGSAGAVIITW